MIRYTVTQAEQDLDELLDRVAIQPIVVERDGHKVAVFLSPEHHRRLQGVQPTDGAAQAADPAAPNSANED